MDRRKARIDQAGVSLIELVVVFAVVGILAMIAIPGYRAHVRKSHRTAAKAALVDAAMTVERFMTRNGTYVGGTVTPATTDGATYALSFPVGQPTATTFTIQAVPQGGQAADLCGTLTIDQAGARTATGTDPGGPCW
jgi:type IV pilus assembly protein PilE